MRYFHHLTSHSLTVLVPRDTQTTHTNTMKRTIAFPFSATIKYTDTCLLSSSSAVKFSQKAQ